MKRSQAFSRASSGLEVMSAILRNEFCDEKFTSEINLKHHVEIVHSKEKDVGQNSKKRKPENDGKGPDDKSTKKVKFNV